MELTKVGPDGAKIKLFQLLQQVFELLQLLQQVLEPVLQRVRQPLLLQLSLPYQLAGRTAGDRASSLAGFVEPRHALLKGQERLRVPRAPQTVDVRLREALILLDETRREGDVVQLASTE